MSRTWIMRVVCVRCGKEDAPLPEAYHLVRGTGLTILTDSEDRPICCPECGGLLKAELALKETVQ
jgi:DNA-directed RNA polymerase subunit RPC12/RpoP